MNCTTAAPPVTGEPVVPAEHFRYRRHRTTGLSVLPSARVAAVVHPTNRVIATAAR